MALSWGTRRKFVYTSAVAVCCGIVLLIVYLLFFTAAPTCFDGKQNGTETGVDCGGSCSLVCANQAQAPIVLWARAFPNGATSYTAAAALENDNVRAGAKGVRYIFQLYDDQNKLVVEKDGMTDLPPVPSIVIVEPNIDVGNRTVAHVQFAFDSSYPLVWHTLPAESVLALSAQVDTHSADFSQIGGTVRNDSITDATKVTVAAVLYDAQGVAIAASKSLIPLIPHKSAVNVVFTWPHANASTTKADITILPSF